MVIESVVRHARGSYPLIVARGLHTDLLAPVREHAPGRRVVVISDATVAALYPSPIPNALHLTFPAGEAAKSRATWATLTDQLLEAGVDRHAVVIGFGGGVTTDLAGFVAASYLRGIPWIAVPTTTLAMCDAAIGGKTGVDTPHGKNLVGAFHPPLAVIIDPTLLLTLPDAEFQSGLAESVKHAAIADTDLWSWLNAHLVSLQERQLDTLHGLLTRSSSLKARIVSQDEHESGARAILNAGHTIAHALEQVTGYALSHGAAVSIGLVVESEIGERLGITRAGTAAQLAELLHRLDLPTRIPEEIPAAALVDAMMHDKKREDGRIHMALIREIGRAHGSEEDGWTLPVPRESILDALPQRAVG